MFMNRDPSSATGNGAHPRILVIRRDNIGDLVCTTPLLFALRERFPHAHIAALVNTYNESVLAGNPAVDAVHAYEKGKHRGEKRSIASVYADRLKLILRLRRERYDYAILATPGFEPRSLRLARMIGARHVLGYTEPGGDHPRPDIALTYDRSANRHQVEDVFGLLRALGVAGTPPPTHVFPKAEERRNVEKALGAPSPPAPSPSSTETSPVSSSATATSGSESLVELNWPMTMAWGFWPVPRLNSVGEPKSGVKVAVNVVCPKTPEFRSVAVMVAAAG